MQHRTRVKICGITNRSDALCAIEQGVDALGFVFCNRSPRNISISVANEIIKDLSPFVTTVALFMDEPASFVNKVIDCIPLMTLQFHGKEDETYCQKFNLPYI
jgi:phosphoribosylanthranilate isomerase